MSGIGSCLWDGSQFVTVIACQFPLSLLHLCPCTSYMENILWVALLILLLGILPRYGVATSGSISLPARSISENDPHSCLATPIPGLKNHIIRVSCSNDFASFLLIFSVSQNFNQCDKELKSNFRGGMIYCDSIWKILVMISPANWFELCKGNSLLT